MGGDKILAAKEADSTFASMILSQNPGPQRKVGLVSFGSESQIDNQLTDSHSTIQSKIDAYRADLGGTNFILPLENTYDVISLSSKDRRYVLFLSDGYGRFSPSVLDEYVSDEIIIHTIGLGESVDEDTLILISDTTGGDYYHAPTSDDLEDIYIEIAGTMITNVPAPEIDFWPDEPGDIWQRNPMVGTIEVDEEEIHSAANLCIDPNCQVAFRLKSTNDELGTMMLKDLSIVYCP